MNNNERFFGIQHWQNVLFCHWPVPDTLLKPFIPPPLQLDTLGQKAWLTIILFKAKYSRLKYMPKILSYPSFWQMNIRTYVKDDKYGAGIYFLNIHCNDPLAVKLGLLVSLPYVYTPMKARSHNNYTDLKNIPQLKTQSNFHISYKPLKEKVNNRRTNWLVERYRLFYLRENYLMTARVSHASWSLSRVAGEVKFSRFLPEQIENYLAKPLMISGKNNIAYLHPFEKVAYFNEENYK